MKLRDFIERWGLSSLKLKAGFLEAEFDPADPDRAAAWDLYVELLTRITTQDLPADAGQEQAALDSAHALFPLTRDILKKHGSGCGEFAKIAIPVLNQVIRPFTTKWHAASGRGAFADPAEAAAFRAELIPLQTQLRRYTRALAEMAAVEDLTSLENA